MKRLVYKLTGQKKNGGKGYNQKDKPFPYNRSLARFYRVVVEEPDGKGGKKKTVKRVAYAPLENTIFMDEFIDPNAKIEKIRFKNGYCLVDETSEPQKKEFLDILDINGSNERRDNRQPVRFERLDKTVKAQQILDTKETVSKELGIFWTLPHEKLRAIANHVGIYTYGKDEAIWKHHLYKWAENNVSDFKKAYSNPDIDYVDTIARAENYKILVWNDNQWTFNDVPVLKVSTQKNRYEELVAHLINNPQLDNAITNQVREKEGKKTKKVGKKEVDFSNLSAEELFNLAKEKEVVKYKAGESPRFEIVTTGFRFGGLSNKTALKEIEENKDLVREQLEAQLSML